MYLLNSCHLSARTRLWVGASHLSWLVADLGETADTLVGALANCRDAATEDWKSTRSGGWLNGQAAALPRRLAEASGRQSPVDRPSGCRGRR